MPETVEKPVMTIRGRSTADSGDVCPLVLADDPNYLADDDRACAGNQVTTDIGAHLRIRTGG